MDSAETHQKIIGVLKEKGPSLPINIAKALGISSLFISAFLSELTNQKRIKVSSLKLGGSPLYYLDGQREKLEDYYNYLHPREAEAYLLLKEHKVLRDSDQDPATRVALRSIKDFSIGFKLGEEIYWKYYNVSDGEVDEIIYGKPKEKMIEEKEATEVEDNENDSDEENVDGSDEDSEEEVKAEIEVKVEPVKSMEVASEKKNEFDNPLVVEEEVKKKEKPKSEFVQKTINFIKNSGLQIVSEKDHKTKEYNCVVQVKSELGNINFYTLAKDKKTITEADFKKLLSSSQSIPLPAFLLYTGEISKKAEDYLRKYSSVLKAKRIG